MLRPVRPAALAAALLLPLVAAPAADAHRHHHGSGPVAVAGGAPWPWTGDAPSAAEDPSSTGTSPSGPAPAAEDPSGGAAPTAALPTPRPKTVTPGSTTTTKPTRTWPLPTGIPVLPEVPPVLPAVHEAIVKGTHARMRTDGKAAIPRAAPQVVRSIIRAANQIVGKPYVWGGGHGKLVDRGYDCSGTVSYALIRAGLLRSPLVSGDLAKTYSPGTGRYVTVYANAGHVYMEVAGLRLDTSSVGDPGGHSGVRWRPAIGRRAGFRVRHPAGL